MSQDYDDEFDQRASDERQPPDEPAVKAAADRTNAPGIFLILSGLINVAGVAMWVGIGYMMAGMTVDKLEVAIEQNQQVNSPLAAMLEPQIDQIIRQKTGKDPKDLPPDQLKAARHEAMQEVVNQQKQALWQFVLFGVLNLAGTILPILGGIRMRSLRSYGLCVTGAIIAAIPCVSLASCPCFLGAIFGIWALVVLLNPDVKNAFR
jgi:hypothetical protein